MIVALLTSVCFLSASAAVSALRVEYRQAIVPGVRVEGIEVGGLNRQQALDLVRRHIPQPSPDSTLLFLCPLGTNWSINYGDLNYYHDYEAAVDRALDIGKQITGLEDLRALFKVAYGEVDLELETRFNRDTLRRILTQINAESHYPPEDTLIAFDNGNVTLIPGIPGRELDLEGTMALIEQTRLRHHRVLLVFRDIDPELSLDSLKYLNTRLGFYATSFNTADRGRTHNIRTACKSLDKSIIQPGEIFSLNEALGPRTSENNYALAPVFVGGRIVLGYGGGVCQIASTLYNAVLEAELPVIERHGHSRPVSYVPPGRDATISKDLVDFKFQNNRRYPLLLSCDVEEDKLLISIYGHCSDAHNVVYQTETEREVVKHQTVFRVDDSLETGEIRILVPGRDGYEITTYRVATVNNEVVEREKISQSRVEPQTAVILVAPVDKYYYSVDK